MSEITRGSVVQLKSGGPKMTVQFKTAGNSFNCAWFNEKNELAAAVFSPEALKIAD